MTYTPEQLESMSDNEKTLAVAIKSGIKHDVCEMTGIVDIDSERGLSFERYNPLENPAHYMPIAIEHRINIVHGLDPKEKDVTAMVMLPYETPLDVVKRNRPEVTYHKSATGRAVCECFLLMEIEL
jgi:hypothetical protein